MSESSKTSSTETKVTNQKVARIPRQTELLKSMARNYFNIRKACEDSGISYGTYMGWCKDPGFIERRDELKAILCAELESVGWEVAVGTHATSQGRPAPDLIKFYLKSLHPDFKDKKEVSVTGQVEHLHEHEFKGWSREKLLHYINTGEEIEDAKIE